MDRKEFLKTCAGGFCACAAACMTAPAIAAEAPKPEDWKLPFVKRRYAKLLEILADKMDDKTLAGTLHELGDYCSSELNWAFEKYRGDVSGFGEYIKQSASGDYVTYDREKGVITMTTGERADCFCPLNGVAAKTPGVVCNCSLGWQQHTWETLLQKKVSVELMESVLRGGKHCTFEIHILEQSA
jgi:hypothetical protein